MIKPSISEANGRKLLRLQPVGYGQVDRNSSPGLVETLFDTTSIPDVGPTQSPIQ